MAKDYTKLAQSLPELVGGRENIKKFGHCTTRLRFGLSDKDLVQIEAIKSLNGTVDARWAGDELQVVIGPAVADAYRAICKETGISENNASADDSSEKQQPKTIKGYFSAILEGIAACLSPAIRVFVGIGLIKVIVLLGEKIGFLTPDMPTDMILTFVSDAGLYFLPVFIGGFAAKRFGGDLGLGMLMGAMLIAPSFIDGVASGTEFSFLGLPVYSASYAYTAFPSILCGFACAKIQNFVGKHSPALIRTIVEPLVTILVMIPVAFCVLAPLGSVLGNYLSVGIMWMSEHMGFLAVALMSAFVSIIVMTGMHSALAVICLNLLTTVGFDTILLPAIVISNINQGVASLGVAFKTKDKNLRGTGIACGISAVVAGVTEPALFGVNLAYRTPQIAAMLGGGIAGLFAGIMKLKAFSFISSQGIFGTTMFIGEPASNFIVGIIAVVIGAAATFIFTMILFQDKEAPVNAEPNTIYAPLEGNCIPMENIPDATFAQGVLGLGCGIEPSGEEVCAPFEGTVTLVADTKHSVALTSEDGLELLIHVGVDTVNLNGEGFQVFVKEGQKVTVGQKLLTFDKKVIEKAGYSSTTAVLLVNSDTAGNPELLTTGAVKKSAPIMKVQERR